MIEGVLWIVFVLACILVSGVILLQEGKGGGLGEAFGGVGQQTFGVKAEGINKFTGWVSVLVVVLAIVITRLRSDTSSLAFTDTVPALPASGTETSAPAEPGGAPAGEQPAGDQPAGEQPAGDQPAGEQPPAAPAGGGDGK